MLRRHFLWPWRRYLPTYLFTKLASRGQSIIIVAPTGNTKKWYCKRRVVFSCIKIHLWAFGFGFQSNSSYRKLINFKLALYRSFGIKDYSRMRMEKATKQGCGPKEEHWHSLGLSNIFVPFVEHLARIQMVTIPFQVCTIYFGGKLVYKSFNIRLISQHLMWKK